MLSRPRMTWALLLPWQAVPDRAMALQLQLTHNSIPISIENTSIDGPCSLWTALHYDTLWCLSTRFASTLEVLPNLILPLLLASASTILCGGSTHLRPLPCWPAPLPPPPSAGSCTVQLLHGWTWRLSRRPSRLPPQCQKSQATCASLRLGSHPSPLTKHGTAPRPHPPTRAHAGVHLRFRVCTT